MRIEWLVLPLILLYSGLFKNGIHAAVDFPASSPEIVQSYTSMPHIWSSLMGPFGSNQVATLWSWPFGLLLGCLSYLGLNHNLIVIFCVSLILVIGSLGIFKLLSLVDLSKEAKIVAAFFYLSNTYILLLIDGGQILWALAYSFLPLCFYQIEKNIFQRKYLQIWEVLLVVSISFFDLRFFYLLGLILVGRFFFGFINLEKKLFWWWISFWFLLGFQTGIIFLGLHSYWLIPLFFARSSALPTDFVNNLNGDFLNFTTIKHSLLLYQPHWYQNIFGVISSPKKEFLLILFLVVFGFWTKRKNYLVVFLALFSLIGVFLAKGPSEPFGQIFNYFFANIPGFFIFRDPTKFFVFIALGYCLLIGCAVNFFQKKISIKYRFFSFSLVMLFLFYLAWPVFGGWTNGIFSQQPFFNQYIELGQKINQMPNGKMLWIPNKTSSGYMDLDHLAVNGLDLINLRPFATGTKGNYETLNFLREASYSGELLNISGIGGLIYSPLDPRQNYKPDQIVYHQLFVSQLKQRSWIENNTSGVIPILKTKSHQELFFVPQETYLVVGSDQIYGESTKSADLSLSQNGLIFLDQYAGLMTQIPDQLKNFLLFRTSNVDMMMSFLNPKGFIFPAKNLSVSPDGTGWWKREAGDFLQFKDFLFQKYGVHNQDFDLGGGWAIAEGEKSLQISIDGNPGDKIFVRAMQSTRSGQLKIVSNKEIGTVDLNNQGDTVFWFLAGALTEKTDSLTITAKGDITLLNAVAVLTDKQFNDSLNQVSQFIPGKTTAFLKEVPGGNPEVDFIKINNDQYKVQVKGLSKPSTLVFSQSYDPKWQVNGVSSFPIYSIFNGFLVEKDGEYLVEYSPHQYLIYGEIISLTTLLGLAGLLIWKTVKH